MIIQANTIEDAYAKCKDASLLMKIPSVTVFLDEVNTATCLGLFKEILVDKSIDGNVSICTCSYNETVEYLLFFSVCLAFAGKCICNCCL